MVDRRTLNARFFVAPDGTCHKRVHQPDLTRKWKVFERDGGRCRYCNVRLGWLIPRGEEVNGVRGPEIDHVIPRCRGGRNVLDNLVTACAPCNRAKGVEDATPLPLPKGRRRTTHHQERVIAGRLYGHERRVSPSPTRDPA